MTKLETLHACTRAEASLLLAEQADDLDDEPRRDDSLDFIFKEESQKSGELDDALPEGVPQYGDLLDVDWLERGADSLEMEEEVVDVGLTLDLDERDDLEDAGLAIEFDVGSLLTLLPSDASSFQPLPAQALLSEPLPARVQPPPATLGVDSPSDLPLTDGSLGTTALDDLVLPEDEVEVGLDRGDEEVGDDERFPAFDDAGPVSGVPAADEDAPSDDGELG